MNLEWVELTAELLARNVVTSEQIALVLNAPEVLAERLIEQARRRFEGTDTAEATASRQAAWTGSHIISMPRPPPYGESSILPYALPAKFRMSIASTDSSPA